MELARRIAVSGLRAVAVVATFVVALAAGGLLHLDLPVTRSVVAAQVNAILTKQLAGKVTIERIGRVGLTGVGDVRVSARDPTGAPVLVADGVSVRIATTALVRSALGGGGPLAVPIAAVAIRDLDVSVDGDASGKLGLAAAFAARPKPAATGAPGRGVLITIADVSAAHVHVHGRPDGAPAIDADVDALAASLEVAPSGTTIDVAHLDLTTRGMPLGADANGAVDAKITIPAPSGHGVAAGGSWHGAVGSIDETAIFAYDGARIDASLDAPAVSPAQIRRLSAESPIDAPSSVHAEVHGPLDALDVSLHVGVADGAFDVAGRVALGGDKTAKLHVGARAIDLGAIATTAPRSDLAFSGDVSLAARADGALTGDASIETAEGTVAGVTLPAASLHATVARSEAAGLTADASIEPHERGVTATTAVRVRPKGSSFDVAFDAAVSAPRLDDVPRLRGLAHGAVSAKARGSFDVAARRVDAKLEARANDLAHERVRVRSASLTASASGAVTAPAVSAALSAESIVVDALKFDSLRFTASGALPHVHTALVVHAADAPSLDAHADVDLAPAPAVRNVDAVVSRNGQRLHASAKLVSLGGGGVDVDEAVVEGVGAPARLSVKTSPGAIAIHGASAGLDVDRLARLLAFDKRVSGGTLSFDVDAAVRNGGATGHVAAKLSKCTVVGVGAVSGDVDATMSGRRAAGKVHADLADIGSIDLSSKRLELGVGTSPAAAVRGMWGALDFTGRADLAKLRALTPAAASTIGRLGGDVVFQGRVRRDSPTDDTPELQLTGYTARLAVGGATETEDAAAWQLSGTDFGIDARIDGDSGAAEIALRAQDAKGPLVTVDVKASDLPYTKILGAPERAFDLVHSVPIQARVDVPRRNIADFPISIPVGDARGDLTASFVVAGTVGAPVVDGTLTVDHGRSRLAPLDMPLDLTATLHYDAVRATIALGADVRKRRVLAADVTLDAALSDLVDASRRDPMPWTATAHARLDELPLAAIGTLGERDVSGSLSGDVEIDGLHDDASAKVTFDATKLVIGEVSYPKAWMRASVGGQTGDVSARLEQKDGFAEIDVHAGTIWGRALAPRIDGTRSIKVTAVAKALRASAVLPFVAGVLSQLDGRIDGEATAVLDPRSRTATTNGTLTLSDGVVEVAALGSEFNGVSASIAWTPDGVIKIAKATAHALSGEVDASGTIRVAGLALESARFVVDVPAKKRLPLTFEGIQVATVDGHFEVDAKASASTGAIEATVDVPTLHADIPVTGSRTAQELGALDHVTVGARRADARLEPVRLDAPEFGTSKRPTKAATPVTIAVKLGRDVEIRRGTDLRVSLEGGPTAELASTTRVTGQVRLPRGSLDVDGKQFTIDKGTVTFVGDDPSNPQVVLTAKWSGPEGTTVYADFVGPLRSGKVTLRSDPPHTKTEILSLLLNGTADGQGGASSDTPGGASAAAGAAGGIATQPLNRALDDFGLAGAVSTKIDTSTASPRPEVEIQIARDISLQVALVLAPVPGSNPDTTLVTIDWRFLQRWSLATTLGDAGTSILDVVWQYHY